MPATVKPAPRSSAETRERILSVAQTVFSQKGYSHAGLREIAQLADVAPSLLVKYFGTKARLFEEALVAAIIPLRFFQDERSSIGEAIVRAVLDPGSNMLAPAMIALSVGEAESRQVSLRVTKEHILEPMADWLGGEDARARALNILAMTTGFSIFHRNMGQQPDKQVEAASAALFAQSLQALVDRSLSGTQQPAPLDRQRPGP